MEEIKSLKLMLEGKMPMGQAALPQNPAEPATAERIIYVDGGDNKENRKLEEELRNKESLLRN